MKRPPPAKGRAREDLRLWSLVAATVRPLPGRSAPPPSPVEDAETAPRSSVRRPVLQADRAAMPAVRTAAPAPPSVVRPPEGIEPNRRRRIARGREPLAVRLDLHGHDQDRAHARLVDALVRAQAEGARAMLVITGKGFEGKGVLRRRVPEWLAAPPLRALVAGVTPADARHGGEGAIYVALKRPDR